MIKRLFTYMIAALALAACSDDEKYTVEPVDDDGTITFTISIPEQEKVVSRAGEDTEGERKINDLSVLIYDNSGDLLQSKVGATDFTAPSGENSYTRITVTLDDKAKAFREKTTIYIIANAGHLLTDDNTATIAALKAVTTDATLPSDEGFIMTGKVESSLNSASLLTNKIILIRTEAKLTIENDADAATFRLESASLYNAATKGYVTAGADNTYATDNLTTDNFDNSTTNFLLYTYPRCNDNPENSDNPENPFIIVRGKYAGNDAYYRLDLYKDKKTLDINSNYWYEIHINSVTGPGSPSAEEAAKHPAYDIDDIEYRIEDHKPEIFNMAFDNVHELGVPHQIIYDGTSEQTLIIKYLSKLGEEDLDEKPRIVDHSDWLTIDETSTPIDGDGGKILNYPLTFSSTTQIGTIEGFITVEWKGLTRTVPVTWIREFKPNELCTATLIIKEGSATKATIHKYWDFLVQNGTTTTSTESSSQEPPILYGIAPDENNDRVRNHGFHFPVMYGNSGSRWSYEYEVTMTGLKDMDDFHWSISKDDDQYVAISPSEGNHVKGNDDIRFNLTRDAEADGYNYTIGVLNFQIGDSDPIKLDLYHTGFFHYDTQEYRQDAKDQSGYYYYEVAPVTTSTGNRYILDRNLGAKSAAMYIRDGNGNDYYGDPKAAGGYYRVADYPDDKTNPKTYDEVGGNTSRVSPPGYRVPSKALWDDMRNSPDFHATSVKSGAITYFSAYYDTGNSLVGNVYFPKSRYKEGASFRGEANAGYYWTKTPATGTEKDEIGKWLKSLVISGTSASYINGHVVDNAMSVRCVNDINDNIVNELTYFNVLGATHIYLYSLDADNNHSGTTTWPGHAVANFNTADKWSYFRYESRTYKPEELYVIFNYIGSDGQIMTLSKEGVNTDKNPGELTGWKVVGEQSLTAISQLGSYWECNFENKKVTIAKKYCIKWVQTTTGSDTDYYRLLITDKNDQPLCGMEGSRTDLNDNVGAPGIYIDNVDGKPGYYYNFFLDSSVEKIKITYFRGDRKTSHTKTYQLSSFGGSDNDYTELNPDTGS